MRNIRIIGIDHELRFIDRLRDNGNSNSLTGHIIYSHPAIEIDSSCSKQVQYQTIWHEIIHGIATYMNITLTEETVDAVSHGIIQVIRDNNLEEFYPEEWKNA